MILFRVPNGRARRRGVVAVCVAICLTLIVGIAAISVEGGALYLQLRSVRKTADAAAMAAACDLFKNYPTHQGLDTPDTAAQAAKDVASSNGFTHGSNETTVTVNIPPKS